MPSPARTAQRADIVELPGRQGNHQGCPYRKCLLRVRVALVDAFIASTMGDIETR